MPRSQSETDQGYETTEPSQEIPLLHRERIGEDPLLPSSVPPRGSDLNKERRLESVQRQSKNYDWPQAKINEIRMNIATPGRDPHVPGAIGK